MGARGEGTIQAGDREVPVLFTNRALSDAEEAMGKSVIAVANGFADGQTGIRDIAFLLRYGMEAARRDMRLGGRAVSMPDAYEVMDEAGYAEVTTAVMSAVAAVLGYSANGDGGEEDPNG